jgi:predicted  nucleic acid-binding Zn-ribbon protein
MRSGQLKAGAEARERVEKLETELARARSEALNLGEQVARLENELSTMKASRAWRAVQAYSRIKHGVWKS